MKKGVIPAAGLGTRLHPLTGGQPKEMLPVGGRPMISYVVREATLSGLEELFIVINEQKGSLRRWLESEEAREDLRTEGREVPSLRITFVHQPTPSGSGDAIYRVRELVGEDTFALMMPDFIFFGSTPALGQMIPIYQRLERDTVGVLPLGAKEARGFGNVGIIEARQMEPGVLEVEGITGKLPGSLTLTEGKKVLKAVGRWILGPHFFSYLERTKGTGAEWDDTPALQMICEHKGAVGKILEGRGFDVGNPLGYQAAEAFLKARP